MLSSSRLRRFVCFSQPVLAPAKPSPAATKQSSSFGAKSSAPAAHRAAAGGGGGGGADQSAKVDELNGQVCRVDS